jgi:polyisoprenoid-binding protein YceI
MPRPRLLLLCCALAIPFWASAEPVGYRLDPVHTRVLFAVSHAGFSHAMGTVSGSTGALLFDPDDWSTATLSVSVPMTRIDLGDDKWNRAASARNLLDVEGHPVATFVSSRIVPKDPQHASVCGTMTLRGVGQDICLDVTLNQLKRHPMPPFRRTAGFSATGTLSRKAFGMDAWPTVIGDDVQLRIEAEAVRSSAVTRDAASGAGTAGQNAEPPAAQTAERPEAHPVEQPEEQPVEPPTEPVEQPIEAPVEPPVDEPAEPPEAQVPTPTPSAAGEPATP